MSSATPAHSDSDWLDASHYKTIAARRFADFYRKNLLPTTDGDSVATSADQGIQETAAQWVLQRLEALNAKPDKTSQEQENQG